MEHLYTLKTILTNYLSNHPEPIIRKRVFAKLPRETVLEYANYYEIPNPELLTSNQICDRLYSRASEIRALKQHVRNPMQTGVIVSQNVKDLVARLAEHQSINLDGNSSKNDHQNIPASSVVHFRKDIKTQLFDILVRLLAGCAGIEIANLVADVASSFGKKYLGSMDLSRKRSREDDDEAEALGSRKRARRSNSISNSGSSSEHALADGQVLWVDYVYDESDESDSSYVSSTGTGEDDDADMTLEERKEARVYIKRHMYVWTDKGYISGDLSSEGETEVDPGDQVPLRWKDYPSEEESDSDDPDYVPPRYSFEDILEIVTERSSDPSRGTYYAKMDCMRYMDELVDRGPLSEAGISDSDSNGSGSDSGEPFRGLHTLRRTINMFRIPQHLDHYSTLPPYLTPPLTCYYTDVLEDLREKNPKWYKTYARYLSDEANQRKAEPDWETCDHDARLDTVLTGDHLEYAFDDWEWKAFVNPRRSPTLE